jgi:ABC-2 type transport system ATP-binding protein
VSSVRGVGGRGASAGLSTAPVGTRHRAAGAVLALDGVVKRYRGRTAPALDGVDLAVAPGQVLALLGPNGAGKSTLIGVASGLLKPDAGTARVVGVDPHRRRSIVRSSVGLAPQEIGIYPALTVRQNLRALGEMYGLRARRARERADELLGPFALEELADRPAGELSGGQRRRVHAAGALINDPRLVLMDEPTAGADPRTRSDILRVVRAAADAGAAVLYTTHYLPEVEQLDADVALLEAGRIVAADSVAGLVARHAETALLLTVVGPVPDAIHAAAGATVLEAGDPGDPAARTIVRVAGGDPSTRLRELLVALGDEAPALDAVEIVRPSLDAAYLALTGRRAAVAADVAAAEEAA